MDDEQELKKVEKEFITGYFASLRKLMEDCFNIGHESFLSKEEVIVYD